MPPQPRPGPARPPPSPAAALPGRHARAFAARPRTRRPLATRVPPPRSTVRPPARPGRTASGARFGAALPIPPSPHTHTHMHARAPLTTPLLPHKIWACSTQPEVWGNAHVVGVVIRVSLLIWFGRVAWLAASGRGVGEWDAWARALAGRTTLRRAGVLSSSWRAAGRAPARCVSCTGARPTTRTRAGTHAPTHVCTTIVHAFTMRNMCSRLLHARTRRRGRAEHARAPSHTHTRERERTRRVAEIARSRSPRGRRRCAARRTIPPPTEWPARPVDGTGPGRRIGRVRMGWLKAGGWRGAGAGLQIAPRRSVGQGQPTEGRVGVAER